MTEIITDLLKKSTMDEFRSIEVNRLKPSPHQPRRQFNPDQLEELATSIRTTGGVLQPVVVRELSAGTYEIVAGERRWLAAQQAGFVRVHCWVRDFSDAQAQQAALIENVSRADLNPIEEATAYAALMQEHGYTHDQVAAIIGKSRSKISNLMRLLKTTPSVQQALIRAEITEGHGKLLAGLTAAQQNQWLQRCLDEGWSVQALTSALKRQVKKTSSSSPRDVHRENLQQQLSAYFGCEISVTYTPKGQGSITLKFQNLDVLEGLFERMGFVFED